MKYCPQCKRQFTESWLSFCSDDGAQLIEDLSPPLDPNWNPKIREPRVATQSEQETQWFPRQPAPGGWIAPDERPPLAPGAWQPPPPPYLPPKQPSQGLALGSMITGIVGVVAGGCLGPIPGIVAVALGMSALSKIKKSPEEVGGKSFATAGVILGGINIAFFILLIVWFILAAAFG